LVDAIVGQGAMLNTASTVTDSSLMQHERTRQRRRTKRNMFLNAPTIVAVVALVFGMAWAWRVFAHPKRNDPPEPNPAPFHQGRAISGPTSGPRSGLAAADGIQSGIEREEADAVGKM
jgi:hypothetical protein